MKLALCLLLLAVSVQLGSACVQGEDTKMSGILEAIGNLTKQIENVKEQVATIQTYVHPPTCPAEQTTHPCGGTIGWRRVAYLDMNDTLYQCPAGWRLTGYPVRTCGRASAEGKTCDSVSFDTGGAAYTEVCGRVVGYQYGKTAAFRAAQENESITIDESYVTGVSITKGCPREHLWTYAAGRFEPFYINTPQIEFCPCEHRSSLFIPPYVGAHWFCESGDNTLYGTGGYKVFADDPLWDGEGCHFANRCCEHEGPLYLVRQLPSPTTDPIEVRICNYYSSQSSDVLVANLELYVK